MSNNLCRDTWRTKRNSERIFSGSNQLISIAKFSSRSMHYRVAYQVAPVEGFSVTRIFETICDFFFLCLSDSASWWTNLRLDFVRLKTRVCNFVLFEFDSEPMKNASVDTKSRMKQCWRVKMSYCRCERFETALNNEGLTKWWTPRVSTVPISLQHVKPSQKKTARQPTRRPVSQNKMISSLFFWIAPVLRRKFTVRWYLNKGRWHNQHTDLPRLPHYQHPTERQLITACNNILIFLLSFRREQER